MFTHFPFQLRACIGWCAGESFILNTSFSCYFVGIGTGNFFFQNKQKVNFGYVDGDETTMK